MQNSPPQPHPPTSVPPPPIQVQSGRHSYMCDVAHSKTRNVPGLYARQTRPQCHSAIFKLTTYTVTLSSIQTWCKFRTWPSFLVYTDHRAKHVVCPIEGGDLALTLTPLRSWSSKDGTCLHVQSCFGCSERIFCCLVNSYTDFVPLILGVY